MFYGLYPLGAQPAPQRTHTQVHARAHTHTHTLVQEKRRSRRTKGAARPWRIKRMALEHEQSEQAQRGNAPLAQEEQDMERFLEVCVCGGGVAGGGGAVALGSWWCHSL